MATIFQEGLQQKQKTATSTMRALVFRGPNQIKIEHVSIPKPGPGEALIRVTLTTICGTDLHILKGEYAVKPGLIIGHEPVGTIHQLGVGVSGYTIGERVLVGAITPCGQCNYCLGGDWSQCGGAMGGWKFGNTINGAQAEYLLVPNAQAISPRFLMTCVMSRWCCWRTSLRPEYRWKRVLICRSEISSQFSTRDQ